MLENYEEYEQFAKHITYQVELMKLEQFRIMISKYFNQDYKSTINVVWALQRNNVILASDDGWVMTPGMYKALTQSSASLPSAWASDEPGFRLTDMDRLCSKHNKALSVALWVVADMMPQSYQIMRGKNPWVISFTTEATEKYPATLYQITYIKAGDLVRYEMLNAIPQVSKALDSVKPYIRRICIIEDESEAYLVPNGLGFRYIMLHDENEPKHYRVLETRNLEQMWGL